MFVKNNELTNNLNVFFASQNNYNGLKGLCIYNKPEFNKTSELYFETTLLIKDKVLVDISIKDNKGSVSYNEETIISILSNNDLSNFLKVIDIYIDDSLSTIEITYDYNILNKTYFIGEVNRIKNRIIYINDKIKDKQDLYYVWNKISQEKRGLIINKLAREYIRDGFVDTNNGYWYFNKFDIINNIKNNPNVITKKLYHLKVIKDKNIKSDPELLVNLTQQIVEKILILKK